MIMMTAPDTIDPKNPDSKPHGTIDDQVKEMESEGQAQQPPAPPATETESPGAGAMHGASGPKRTEFDKTMSDQDIDTAGTEADED